MLTVSLVVASTLLGSPSAPSPTAQAITYKKVIDASTYDIWNSIRSSALSRDGQWLMFTTAPQEGDGTLTLRHVTDGKTISVARGTAARFTKDSKFLLATIQPPFLDARKARRDKSDAPKNNLLILNLSTGERSEVPGIASYLLPEEDAGWFAYKADAPKPAPAAKPAEKAATPDDDESEDQRRVGARSAGAGAPTGAPGAAAKGDTYVVKNLAANKEEKLENVADILFNRNGSYIAFVTKPVEGKGGGLNLLDLTTGKRSTVAIGDGKYSKLAFSRDGQRLAFLLDRETINAPEPKPEPKSAKPEAKAEKASEPESKPEAKETAPKTDDKKPKAPTIYWLWLYDASKSSSTKVGADSMPKDWSVNEFTSPRFSKSGDRLIYATSPKPTPDPVEQPDDEKVSVDIWNWKDKRLQLQQLLGVTAEKQKGFLAIYDIPGGTSHQLGDDKLPSLSISNENDGVYALASDTEPYERASSWDPGYQDLYLVNVMNGERKLLANAHKGGAQLSPTGAHTALYSGADKSWTIIDNKTGKAVKAQVPFPIYDEEDDHPDFPDAYGTDGWTKSEQLIIKDKFDLWLVEPATGTAKAITNGRIRDTKFTRVDLDAEETTVDVSDLLLTSLNLENKQGGVWRSNKSGLTQIFGGDKTYGGIAKAKDADTLIFTRQDYIEYPDIWLTDIGFKSPQKVSSTNPQQKDYNWGKTELVHWTSLDGTPLSGILVKPENFDYSKKYPMITYFYERMSENLNRYTAPSPSASTVNWTYLASNGYCVFIPDIPYKVGYPGASALSAIVPGVQSIVSRGYVDPKRLGIQGQSWGGYQTAFLVTQTNMFACAEAGAPVTDMFSAYGGIRYGSGVVRQFQYEHQQSRIGGTPWDSTLRYIESSPQFWLDRVQTPLMIMSNDKDGAVPHTQGIELFTGLRRLNKPAWMVTYNGEDHNIVERKNRKDFSIRLYQFFDHYLKGAPAPVWMEEGLPAKDKGKTYGLELSKKVQP